MADSPVFTCDRLTVPVEVELPPETLAACRRAYERERERGSEPVFADFLCDVIEYDPTFTYEGVVLDPKTGYITGEVSDRD